MKQGDAELQSDTQRPRQHHPPSASLNGQGERGGGGVEEEGREGVVVGGGRPAQEAEVWVWPSLS